MGDVVTAAADLPTPPKKLIILAGQNDALDPYNRRTNEADFIYTASRGLKKIDELFTFKKTEEIVLVKPYRKKEQSNELELRYNQLDHIIETKAEEDPRISWISLKDVEVKQEPDGHPSTAGTAAILTAIEQRLRVDMTLDPFYKVTENKYRGVRTTHRVGCPTCYNYDRVANTDYCHECTIHMASFKTAFTSKQEEHRRILEDGETTSSSDCDSDQMIVVEESKKRERPASAQPPPVKSKTQRDKSPTEPIMAPTTAKSSEYGQTGRGKPVNDKQKSNDKKNANKR